MDNQKKSGGERTSPASTKRSVRRIIAENLRIIRLLRNLSQEALAELSGLDRGYLGSVERAERNLSLDNLEKLATALGITVPELLREPEPGQIAEQFLNTVRNIVGGCRARRSRD